MTTEPVETFEHAGMTVEIVYDEDYGPQDNDNAGTIYSWTDSFDGDERISEPDLRIPCSACDGTGEGKRYEILDVHAYGRTVVVNVGLSSAVSFDTLQEAEGFIERLQPEGAHWVAELQDCPTCEGSAEATVDIPQYMRYHYDAVLTIPLRFSDYGSSGARIYESDDPNCALCFTQREIDYEWSGHLDPYPVEMKDENGEPTGEIREYGGARSYAEARINELDEFMQGYSFGIVIRDPEGKDMDSVWGFIGDLNGESGKYIYEEAKSMAEACAEEIAREKAEAHRWACADVVTV